MLMHSNIVTLINTFLLTYQRMNKGLIYTHIIHANNKNLNTKEDKIDKVKEASKNTDG